MFINDHRPLARHGSFTNEDSNVCFEAVPSRINRFPNGRVAHIAGTRSLPTESG